MNRTIKDASVKCFHYGSHDQLRMHLAARLNAYNFARWPKTLTHLASYGSFFSMLTSQIDRFIVDRAHQLPRIKIKRTIQHTDALVFTLCVAIAIANGSAVA